MYNAEVRYRILGKYDKTVEDIVNHLLGWFGYVSLIPNNQLSQRAMLTVLGLSRQKVSLGGGAKCSNGL